YFQTNYLSLNYWKQSPSFAGLLTKLNFDESNNFPGWIHYAHGFEKRRMEKNLVATMVQKRL
ncbi:hypothetical protein L9F63_002505, partial [Diploptera punctata]